jgi:phosphate transport system protein
VQQTTTHLEESLEQDIERIRGKVTDMAVRNEAALTACVKALVERNRQLAYAIILRDQYIDALEKEIDRLCLEFIVRQQPAAGLLRFAYAAIKINLELERVGDYAESIARQILKLIDLNVQIPLGRLLQIADVSIPMLHDAIQAFVNQDADLARKTIETEEAVDLMKSSLNQNWVRLFGENKLPFEALNPLLMISRRLERVSDQARNICMEVLYLCTGENAKHPGSEIFRILFVDEDNACDSQMAEGIANALGQPGFLFASAGLEPKPIAQATLGFMQDKHIDLSRAVSKSLSQVPHLDHYRVIVSLARSVKRAFPQRPHKVVFLDWSLKNPAAVQGSPADIAAAYEECFRCLHSHIKDLVEAILGTRSTNQITHS